MLALLPTASCALAQAKPARNEQTPADTVTLHVVVRELQVAALVLDAHRRPVASVDPKSFLVQIERRPKFRPMRVHREGDDPLTLAVLIDTSRERRYMDQLPDALANLREKALLPHDRLLLSAVDCKGIIFNGDTSTPDAVRKATQQLLASGLMHGGMHRGKPDLCTDGVHLLDEVGHALRRLSTEPGRHAVLVVSEGYDFGSKSTLTNLQDFTTSIAGTIFVLPPIDMSGPNVRRSPLDQLATLSGGVVLDPPARDGVEASFLECVEMLRDRYILGFHQPGNLRRGHNDLHVSIPHTSYDIHASGVSTPSEVPVSDHPQLDADAPQGSTAAAPSAAAAQP